MSSTKDEAPTNPCFCTFACTESEKFYQAIFVCRTCCSSQELTCVCEGCANHCHVNHELDYLGMANAYCDCNCLGGVGCRIIEASKSNVIELKFPVGRIQCNPAPKQEGSSLPFIMDAYRIPEIYQKAELCRDLWGAASNLVKESKETFWLSNDQNKDDWCNLEKMAWRIFEQNKTLYALEVQQDGGAEWWVQVKKNLPPLDQKEASGSEAVDLHYDKDEELAEKYGLGSFPTLSTVTYLTQGSRSNPTVVLGRMYEQPDDEIISDMLVSHPVLGKHLVFDGRLLHGAPKNADLHKSYLVPDEEANLQPSDLRVTLLVNIWANRKPAGVNPLSSMIRENLISQQPEHRLEELTEATFQKHAIEEVVLEEEEGKQDLMDRIELPFVCKGITWESEDDESSGLVVVTFPPPPHKGDSVYVRFGPGLQAYLDQPYTEDQQDTRMDVNDTTYEDAYI